MILHRRCTWLPLVVLLTLSAADAQVAARSRQDARAEEKFVDDLLSRMTLEEKIEQMEQAAGQTMYTSPEQANMLAKNGIGSFLFFTDPVRINELQHIAMTQSRLHIPILFGYDVIHGFRTIAPIPLAMASSWDPSLVENTQAMAAREARAAGVEWAFAPMVDIARDARWGRIMESAGEDPFLGEQMAAAQVRGFQGPFIGAPDHIITSVKHFAGYGAVNGGRDYDSADISDEQLNNVYLRPYRAAVDAGSAAVMSAYMNLNGVPATGNAWLLQDVLRKQWGFNGFVVSDWDSVISLKTHGFAADDEDAATRAVQAGVNMEMTSSSYRKALPAAVKSGQISVAQIDALVGPLLRVKYEMNLFDQPYVDLNRYQRETLSADQRKAVEHAAEHTAVLLKNEGHLLPLQPNELRKVALIGPLADSALDTMGSWAIHGDRKDTVTIAAGLRELLGSARVEVTKGVEIERGSKTIFDEQVVPDKPSLVTPEQRDTEFRHALALAKSADICVLVLGEAQTMSGESASRGSLKLPGEQERLLESVAGLGKPVVLVVMTGRPLNLSWAVEHVPAILNVWYPGTEGGHAVAKLLTGAANPDGHLPLTWPRSVGQEPIFYNDTLPQNPENKAHRYWDLDSTPQFPFGYGLSYSDIMLSDLRLNSAAVGAKAALEFTVRLENRSDIAGAQVVQVYTHQRVGTTVRPARELKSFQKISLAPHASRVVKFSVPASSLSYWSPILKRQTLEPGTFDLWVGFDSNATLHDTFQLAPADDETPIPKGE